MDAPCGAVETGSPGAVTSWETRLLSKPCTGWPTACHALNSAPVETTFTESLGFVLPFRPVWIPASMNQGKAVPTSSPAVTAGCSAEPSTEVVTKATRILLRAGHVVARAG